MQSIIVYRNPLEAAVWESFSQNGASIFPSMVGIVAFFVIFLILNNIVDKAMYKMGRYKKMYRHAYLNPSYISLALSAFASIAITYNMWLP